MTVIKEKKSRKFHKKNDTKFFANLFCRIFAKIFQNAGHHNFPKDPKFIFISTGFDHDELLKFYIAKNVERGKNIM